MKKLMLLSVLLLGLTNVNAQFGHSRYIYGSIGLDAKNAYEGSEPTHNKRALDVPIYFGVVGEKGWGVSAGVETFKKLSDGSYFSWNVKVSKEFYLFNDKVSIIPSIEYVKILRNWNSTIGQIYKLNGYTTNSDGSITSSNGEVYTSDYYILNAGEAYVSDIYNHFPPIKTTQPCDYDTFGANLDINYNFNEIHSLGLRFNGVKRADLEDRYKANGDFQPKFSVYVVYTIKLELE